MANSMPRQEISFKAIKSSIVAGACLVFQMACAHNQPGPNEAVITEEYAPFASFVSTNTPSILIDIENSNGSFSAMRGETGTRLYECGQVSYRLCLYSTTQKMALFIPIEMLESDSSWRFENLLFSVAHKFRNTAMVDVRFDENDTEIFRYVLDGEKIIGFAWGNYAVDICEKCFQARITYIAIE